jgi:pimeloyl-ACP methyl ester carboxylesterase
VLPGGYSAFRPLRAIARIPGSVFLILQSLRSGTLRRLALSYGWLMKRFDDALAQAWLQPARSNAAIRRQVASILTGSSARYTLEAAERFGEFKKPVLIAWAPEDRFFKFRSAERLGQAFPDARLDRIEDSYTFVPIDQPERTADLIASFVREPLRDQNASLSN